MKVFGKGSMESSAELAAHRLHERLGFVHVPERDEEDPRGFLRLVYPRRSDP